MTARFLNIIPWLWTVEGTKYENDPDDSGGETRYGVDKRSHPGEDIKNLTEDRAKQIYWNSYWSKYGCENYPYPLGECVFNVAVNAGYGRVQKIFNGGAKTAEEFLDAMDAFYYRLANARPKDKKFLRGWLARTASLRKKLGIQ